VVTMNDIFGGCAKFNSDISAWQTLSLENIAGAFFVVETLRQSF
jgi:hypothetical protein